MNDVVASPAARQMPQDPGAEDERRQDPAPVAGVEPHPRAGGDDLDPRQVVEGPAVPLTQGHERHLVAVVAQPQRQVAVPALGAADGVREQAVVDDAHAHLRAEASQTSGTLNQAARKGPTMSTAQDLPATLHDPGGVPAEPLVSVVIPCLNEEINIETCVTSAREAMAQAGISGEVVVVDNASEDRSAELAANAGARVVSERRRGYGSAYLAGFAAARGTYIVMGDADQTYDFAEIPRFVTELENGAELVMGDRMKNIQPGAMPWHHRYIGNPVLTGILNTFFHTGVSDAHCGMRALRRDVLPRLDLRTTGMEFASEMVIRAAKENLEDRRVPDRVPPARRRVEAVEPARRLAPPALPARPQPQPPVPAPRLVITVLGSLIMGLVIARIQIFGRAL